MKAVVFGSSGFLGSHLVERLTKMEIEVLEIHHEEMDNIKPEHADYIFYLASYGNHYFQDDQFACIEANCEKLYKVLKKYESIDYRNFIYFSTSSVKLPIQTAYSISKAQGEKICLKERKKGKNVTIIRPYSVYGSGEASFRFIPKLIDSLITNKHFVLSPNPSHDWIFVEDFINALILCLDVRTKKPIDIGTGTEITNWTVFDKLRTIINPHFENFTEQALRIYDTDSWVADNSFIKSLGWKQNYSIEEGLIETYEYIESRYKEKNN